MMRKKLVAWLMTISAILLVGCVLFTTLYEDNPYRHYTGLADTVSVSPDHKKFAFSYYQDGQKTIFTADRDGGNVTRLDTYETGTEQSDPIFSPRGKGLLFLEHDGAGGQSLHYMADWEEGEPKKLTKHFLKVFTAAFSPDGDTIYFTASPVDDGSLPKDITESTNLYAIGIDGNRLERLTRDPIIPMSRLAVSPDGKKIYFIGFEEEEQLYIYNLDSGTNVPAERLGEEVPYDPVISPDGKQIAYTAVAKTEEGEGLFEYEIFTKNINGTEEKQISHDGKHASVPVFLGDNKIAYLLQENWPNEPAEYGLRTASMNSQGTVETESVNLDMPPAEKAFHIDALLDQIIGLPLIAGLYAAFFICWTILLLGKGFRMFLPGIISGVVTAASLAVAKYIIWRDPFITVDLSMYAILFGAITAGIVIFGLVIRLRFSNLYEESRISDKVAQ